MKKVKNINEAIKHNEIINNRLKSKIVIDDYENINSANPLYLISGKADGYIKENNGSKYLAFISTNGNKNY